MTALRTGQVMMWNGSLWVNAEIGEAADQYDVTLYGATGDGTTDDRAAVQSALTAANASAAGGGTVFFPAGTYALASAISLTSNIKLLLDHKAKLFLKNSSDSHVISIASGASRVAVVGGEIDGNKGNNAGGHGITVGASGATFVTVQDCYIHDCDQDGVRFTGTLCEHVVVSGCSFDANGTAGLTSDSTIQHFSWVNNTARDNGTHGIGLIGIGKHGTISGNVSEGSGIADNFTGYNASNDHLTVTGNVSRGGANHGIHFGGSNLVIADNVVDVPAQSGIVVRIDGSTAVVNVVVSGNVIDSPVAGVGIWCDKMTEFSITGNTVVGSASHGIWLAENNTDGTVSGNTCKGNAANGIRLEDTDRVAVTGNNARSNAGGIVLSDCDDCVVSGNVITGNTSNGVGLAGSLRTVVTSNKVRSNAVAMEETGTSDYSYIADNDVRGNTDSNIYLAGANSELGYNVGYDITSIARTIASDAIAIPAYAISPVLFVALTGEGGAADTISSITGGKVGQILILQAADEAVTITVSGVGNIYTNGPGGTFGLTSRADTYALVKAAAPSGWLALTPGSDNAV